MSERLIGLLRELVAIDSTSTRSNLPIIDVLEKKLTALGFRCERQQWADEQGIAKANLIARAGQGLPELALIGHSDCVPFDPAWAEALTLTVKGPNLAARGACDTKAFIACAITAAERALPKLTKPIMLVFTADEELGCIGAKKLVEAGTALTRRAIIGEPTSLRPIRANKGYCLAEVEVTGKEGHSAYPETGTSAIFGAARLLAKLEQFSKTTLRVTADPKFVPPYATLNVGLMNGGKAKNVIPGHAKFTLEWRPLPAQRVEEVLEAVEGLIADCVREDPTFAATVRPLRMDRGFDTQAEADVIGFLEQRSGKRTDTVSFGTEGPQLFALGAVPVVFGPGDITVAHQTGEFVPVDELISAANILEGALLHFAS